MIAELPRLARRARPERVPRAVEGEPGIFAVDATWGVIQPISLAPGVRTVGELEVIEHLRAGRPLVDCRLPEYVDRGTIPGAVNIPHDEIVERIAELDPVEPTVVFCNGPQCTATAQGDRGAARGGLAGRAAAVLPRRDPRLGDARPAPRRARELKQPAPAASPAPQRREAASPRTSEQLRSAQLHRREVDICGTMELSYDAQTYSCVDDARSKPPRKAAHRPAHCNPDERVAA